MVAVDYALAPEHRYPTQVEQAHAALVWLFDRAGELGIDSERIAVAGTSAGACISAALSLVNLDRTALPIRLQVLGGSRSPTSPAVTSTSAPPVPCASRRSSPCANCARSRARICPAGRLAREPYASPLRAASHEGLPPAVILTAEYDPLRGDGIAYAAALRRAGVEASAVQYLGVTARHPDLHGSAARRASAACGRRDGASPAARP